MTTSLRSADRRLRLPRLGPARPGARTRLVGPPSPAPGGGRIAYQPALDGLRGVAVLGVVAYHAGIGELRGGFLGVSAFFTLSGFLITSLLLTERRDRGRIALGSFWSRRVRRLLPASLLAIAATVVVAAMIGDDSQLSRLRVDGLSALFHFSNWRFVAGGDSYGALFESPSFFRHFWSLAVEEQFYLVFPLVVAGAMRVWRGPARGARAALALAAVVAIVWPALLLAGGASTDRLYFGTDTRIAELLIGAGLAVWWVRRDQGVTAPISRVSLLAAAAGLALGAMWMTAHPDDRFLYQGGFALHAVLIGAVIVAAVAPRGPVRAVLSVEPLRRIGVVSYGVYLFHWPVLLWLQQETDLTAGQRFLLGSVLAIGLAELSYRVVERPIRHGTIRSSASGRVWLFVPATLAVAALVIGVGAWRSPHEGPIDFAGAQAELAELVADVAPGPPAGGADVGAAPPASSVAGVVEVAPRVSEPVRLAGFGDSTALMTGLGVARWAQEHPEQLTMVVGQAKLGCGLVSGGMRKLEDRTLPVPQDCDPWLDEWIDSIRGQRVDVAMVQVGAWDIVDHQLDGGGSYLAIGRDPHYEALLRANLGRAIEGLKANSELVVLLAHPDIGQGRFDSLPAGVTYPEYDPSRSARWRAIVAQAAAADPDVVVVDLASWIHAHPDERRLRPDGVHFTGETAREVAEWLAPELLAAYRDWQAGPPRVDQAVSVTVSTNSSSDLTLTWLASTSWSSPSTTSSHDRSAPAWSAHASAIATPWAAASTSGSSSP